MKTDGLTITEWLQTDQRLLNEWRLLAENFRRGVEAGQSSAARAAGKDA